MSDPRRLQRHRAATRIAFFALFVLAPPLDILRLDLNLGHFILFGHDWTLGIDDFIAGRIDSDEMIVGLVLRGFMPLALLAGGLIWVAWRWGRLYCGWLCPHFSVVETINGLMLRASGKPSLWERRPLPSRRADGSQWTPDRRWWVPTWLAIGLFSFLWALTLLTYLLPPREIYANLLHGALTRNQFVFLAAATVAFSIEFTFARHLFCRFGCAVGVFQSLAWMANPRAMVVGFDTTRARACQQCNNACDNACPMRLKPRGLKRGMFSCTQCGQCLSACTEVQRPHQRAPLLEWVDGERALGFSEPPVARPLTSSETN